MKRLISIIFVFAFFGAMVFSQPTHRDADSKVLKAGQFFYEYTGVAADTCGTEQDSVIFEVLSNKPMPLNVAVRVESTRTGTTDDYEIRLQGKVFENDTYASLIDSTAQTADLSLYHPDVEVDVTQAASVTPFYRYFRVVVANDGTCAVTDKLTIDAVIWKFWERK